MTSRTGRPMTSRIRVRGWLRTESPLHVGGLSGDPSDPLPLAVDGEGRLYVPGTSLAGALRSWMRGAGPEEDLKRLWGFIPEGDHDEEEGQASRVIVADALIAVDTKLDEYGLPENPLEFGHLEFRPSVGIDRVTGAAVPEFLYGRAVVPAGNYVRLALDIECHDETELDEARMGAMLDALASREVRLGAATGKGFGVLRLLDDPLELVVDRFDSPDELLAVLRDAPFRRRTLASLRTTDPRLPARRDILRIRIAWRPIAPVMVRSGTRGLIVDTLPLTTRVDRRHLTLVLPGSSIKGALRSHAELVERTARGTSPSKVLVGGTAARHSAAFRARLDALPAVRKLFGAARDDEAARNGGEERRAGALRVEECVSHATIPDDLWDSVTGAGSGAEAAGGERETLPEQVRDRLDDLGLAEVHHVALDRWTGGAADGRLFSALEPHAVEWEPIRMSVDLSRLRQDGSALALLLLTLRDLSHGRITLGAAANRGFGDIQVDEITLVGGPWPTQVTLTDALRGAEIEPIAHAWTRYLETS